MQGKTKRRQVLFNFCPPKPLLKVVDPFPRYKPRKQNPLAKGKLQVCRGPPFP